MDEAIASVPRFDAETGERFEWYYRFTEKPIGPFDPRTGVPIGGYAPRELVVEHNIGVSGRPTFWSSGRGVWRRDVYLEKNTRSFHGTGRRLPEPAR